MNISGTCESSETEQDFIPQDSGSELDCSSEDDDYVFSEGEDCQFSDDSDSDDLTSTSSSRPRSTSLRGWTAPQVGTALPLTSVVTALAPPTSVGIALTPTTVGTALPPPTSTPLTVPESIQMPPPAPASTATGPQTIRPPRKRKAGRPPSPSWARGRPRSSTPTPIPSTSGLQLTGRGIQPPSNWSDDPQSQSAIPPFTGLSNYNISCNEITPIAIFYHFLDEKFFEDLVTQTNLYARQQQQATVGSPHSYLANWSPVDVAAMKTFLSIVLSIGLVKKPRIRDYWSNNPVFKSNHWSSLMARNRFSQILSFLHVNNNATYVPVGQPGHDPLFKLRPVISHLQTKFKDTYYPKKEISIDEATCPFKGRVKFLAYNPDKPHKWGIKIYQLCESDSGYCFGLKVADGSSMHHGTGSKTFGLVMEMMAGYLNRGHELYMDRYYTSVPLYEELYRNNTIAVGTCMNRRGLPKDFLKQPLKTGEIISCKKGALLALKWKDKKDVLMLSTKHTPDTKTVQVRAPGGRRDKIKPVVVQDYNDHMAGVDKSDQLISYYSFQRKTLKWWTKLFFHLINLTVINAQKVHNRAQESRNKPKMPLMNFILDLVKGLADDGSRRPAPQIGLVPSASADRLTGRHFMEKLPATTQRTHAQRDCRVCSEIDQRKRESEGSQRKLCRNKTQYFCKQCKLCMCVVPCFELYHSKNKYWEFCNKKMETN